MMDRIKPLLIWFLIGIIPISSTFGGVRDSLLTLTTSQDLSQAAIAYKELARLSAPDSLALTIYYSKKGIALAQAVDDKLLVGNLYMNLGVAHDIHDRFEEAISRYDTARQVFAQLEDIDTWMATLDINYGAAYYFAGFRSLALEHWLKAYDKIDKNGEDGDYAALLNNIATVYEELGKYADAIKYYEESLVLKKERSDEINYFNSLMNLGKIYGLMGKPEEAWEYLEEAELGFEKLGQKGNMINVQIYKAQVKLGAGLVEEASALILPLVKDGLLSHRNSRRIEGLTVAGEVCDAKGNYAMAIHYFSQALAVVEDSGVRFDHNKLLEKFAASLFKANRPAEAYEQLRKGFDGVVMSTEQEQIALEQEMQVKFNTLQKEQENMKLQSQNLIKDLSLRKTRRTLGLTLLGLILIAGFAIQIFLNRRKVKKLNRSLQRQKDVISSSLAEKEILLKEIHHRVKNNLQVVSSLLGIQARQVKDQAAFEALRESRSRVLSMTLIHQNLYSHDHLMGIGLKNYFRKLTENLFHTYSLSNDQIHLTSDIDEIVLDVDTVIPLGLVLNELISNALKYAFPDGSGKIHVTIKESSDGLLLSVRDNGIGMHDPDKTKQNDSFGYDLINSFVEKMDGELEILVNQGTEVRALLKSYEKAA